MTKVVCLPVVEDGDATRDTILSGPAPLLEGKDSDHLACGACNRVLARNLSARTLYERLCNQTGRLLLECPCGAVNAAEIRKFRPITTAANEQ